MQLPDGASPRFLWGFCPFIIPSALWAKWERESGQPGVGPVTREDLHQQRVEVSIKAACSASK